jgi:hypothetical protein
LSGKALNQDVTLMTGGILKSKELHTSQTTISVSAGEMLKYATTLVDAKLEQEALFTFMGVQNKSIKKHFWRDYHRKIIICIYKF